MKKEYNRPSHGNSPGESTNQHVHADSKPTGHNILFLNPKNKKNMSNTTQNKRMKKKKVSLLMLAMFGFLTVFMVGCQKDDDYPFQNQVIERYTHRHFDVIKDQKYDSYLEFKSIDDLKVVNEYLDSLETQEYSTLTGKTPLTQWENTVEGFTSLRTIQKEENFDKKYSSPAFATLLNNNGYIKVAGILYHDKGDEVYVVSTEGSEKLYFSQETDSYIETQSGSLNKSVNCSWSDADNLNESNYCSPFGYTFKVWVQVDHWKHYITGNERIYGRATSKAYDCMGYRVNYINFQHKMSYIYYLSIDGNPVSGSGTYTVNTSEASSKLIESGDDVCLDDFASVTVKATALGSGGNVLIGQSVTTTAEAN